ncbi:MAG: hypothetical protein R2849_03880 [Thermomicrobiales bacterium]
MAAPMGSKPATSRGYDAGAVVEEYYDAAWAEHYDPGYGYEHPFDLYGQPDPPGENQNPNVHVFGGGRAMVVRNADGSETITWYSEGGYQDGYVEYKGDGRVRGRPVGDRDRVDSGRLHPAVRHVHRRGIAGL